ncbi:MAG: hypothetical protein E7623_00235 [Ruminococcaceae bacterium]|nr:hypothetical protein [Oscillospiraceae bacterium]
MNAVFNVCCYLSLITFIGLTFAAVFVYFKAYRQSRLLQPGKIFAVAVFLSSVFIFFPIYLETVSAVTDSDVINFLMALILSAHNTIRLFIVDGEFSIILDYTQHKEGITPIIFDFIASVMFIVAPILSFGAVLLFFENLTARRKYLFGFFRDTYIFSDLNEKSITLAKSIKDADPGRVIVFTDVFKSNEERSYELIEQAKELDAILFKSDISIANFRTHSKKAKLYFFLISDDEEENVNQLMLLSAKPRKGDSHTYTKKGYDYPADDIRIYLFSSKSIYDNLAGLVKTEYVKIRKVNDVQALIYRLIDEKGGDLFDSASETERLITDPVTGKEIKEKLISAVIVGLGMQGREMLRAISWAAQMFPYRLEITAFDRKSESKDQMDAQYPEMMLKKDQIGKSYGDIVKTCHNGDFSTEGEAHYSIDIIPDTDVTGSDFENKILALKDVTYIMVALGNDDLNIQIATKLRILFRRIGKYPKIHTIVYSPDKFKLFEKGYENPALKYDIVFCGDIKTNFSEECILGSKIEKIALSKHMSYCESELKKRRTEEEALQSEIDTAHKEKNKELAEKLKAELKEKGIANKLWLRETEDQFWNNDYNYRSSMASIIHSRLKLHCGLHGFEKKPQDRTEAERRLCRIVEHQRWNAYVRSEGHVFAPARDKLAKTHHWLIPFDELPASEQEKDD